jgi:hypothetical protein
MKKIITLLRFVKTVCFKLILAIIFTLFGNSMNIVAQTTVNIDGTGVGRTFEGEGVLSGGGGNTKLLKDYPEPYRSQILDYLFKPYFGASYNELKVEIGGDINSTSGTEPSHARTLAENANPVMTRGYETWLIDQAKQRNPGLTLYGLEWGAPGWIGNMWSQNNANYLVSYIKGLKSVWGYDMDYIAGNQNESFNGTSTQAVNYIVNILRPTLNANGLSNVKIIAPDILSNDWSFADQLSGNTALKNAIGAVGYHYVGTTTTTSAQNCGLPIWESEGWTGIGDWAGARSLAKEMNLNYINGKMTKTDVWHLINSQYDNANWAHSGIMEANSPWSGYYVVSPAVWAAAHTNQFAQPGWKYLDSGCGITTKGSSYVTFMNPVDKNYSIVVVANDTLNESINFTLSGGLPASAVHVWKSNSTAQFIQQSDIKVSAGKFTINLEAGSIYSITTTTGQQKGNAGIIPVAGSFGDNYSENFESYDAGATPKYLYDISGAFDVESKDTKVLRQVITGSNLEWNVWGGNPPTNAFTEFGDLNWKNYDFSADALIESTGVACIYGRVGLPFPAGGNHSNYSGYRLSIHETGSWKLCYGDFSSFETASDVVLSSGTISPFSANGWHNLKLSFNGTTIKAYIDNIQKDSITDTEKCSGMAGLGSGWNNAQFDNLIVTAGAAGNNESIVSGGIYSISNNNSGKVLSPLGASTASGVNIVQVTNTGSTSQQWLFTDLGTGYWSIKNVASGMSMDISGASTTDGAKNIQYPYSGATNQQWQIIATGCYSNIENRNSGELLDITGASTTENAQDIQWPSNGGSNQQWSFNLLKSPVDGIIPVNKQSDITIYPNPLIGGQLTINGLSGKSTICIVNISGNIVKEQEVSDQQSIQININMIPGIYFVKVMEAKRSSINKLVVGVN